MELGLVTQAKANSYRFKGYGSYFGDVAVEEPVDLLKIAEDIEGVSLN